MLKAKIQDRDATVGVIGLGYVGLPLVLRFCEAGFSVIGFDVDESKLVKLKQGKSYLDHIADREIAELAKQNFNATADFSQIAQCDTVLICVPTPIDRYREPDLSFVIDTVEAIVPHLRAEQLVVLESTTYPGTTDEELLPRVESTGLKVGVNIYLAYSPEREDPGNPNFTTQTIPKVVGGVTPTCLDVATALYQQVIDQVVPVSSTRVAEMSKLLENIHRAVNIGLVNEMKMVADSMDIDINEVINAAATKPFGFVPYRPGPGLGGHCIPIDPFYLTWKAREYGVNTRFIELAGEINSQMPQWVVSKVADGLNDHQKSTKGSRILILGIAYKKNINDSRESPGIEIIELLNNRGAQVDYADPHIPLFPAKRDYDFNMASVELTQESLQEYDCVVLVTDHERFDYPLIADSAKLIIDTRGVFTNVNGNVVSA
ncbi:MAG: nucleotide sugar dehydrogenase [Gammaproteobacteria bacterium]|nr:nucleotide sugar dehydrogenase [Gammaproteobacteria bacterium]